MAEKPVVRFAPSPTGRIHIGNARTALFNYLHARRHGGQFVLRYDDTDRARSTKEFADAIAIDLDWLGVVPGRVERQSERVALYDAAAKKLRDAGLLYACYETEEELEYQRKRLQARHLPPIYNRAALKITPEGHAEYAAEGLKPYWRFKLDHKIIGWVDGVRGETSIDTASLSDPVLIRADGSYLYTLPSVTDDIDMGITDIIRGEDHITNTAVQIQLFEALGAKPPRFAHHNLLTLPSGEGLSKRLGHLSLGTLREEGFEPQAVAALSVLVGTSHNVEPVVSLDDLMTRIALSDISHSPAKFDPAELNGLNARTLHILPFANVADRLSVLGVNRDAEAFWLAVRGNLERLDDARQWWEVVSGSDTFTSDDTDLVALSIPHLPSEPWDTETWSKFTKAVGAASGKKGKALFHPLRLALTGREQGPELKALLPLIGRAKVLRRLEAASR
ncbi:MAG: glutamate--tRNA ligase [Bradyrhizobiaceae bacterium]|nr:MAG: glutamate--tRNA ligase [Bradyrhizobiaceae bacterium]